MQERKPNTFTSPVLDLKAVQDLQTILETGLSWLHIAYPLAQVGEARMEGDEQFRYPQVYKNDNSGEYYDVRPNDSLRSYCFFELNDSWPINEDEVNYSLGLVFWANLKRIDSGRAYDFSRELIKDVYRVIDADPDYKYRITELRTEVRHEEIFSKYSMPQADTQFLMYPYTAFKLEFNVIDQVVQECDAFTPIGNQT